ncbi:hypothetical protein GCK72_000930 [Caenorhabditis remanei]|uniref:Uncharacterized protein n=1 Tax=Caenorhabditis remanei TaxID=31234 RepID=A0A6A5HR10_CAERE|nr:hypothetical protein GCK72_000930 [Caenorhabditis remanei]KAF1769116.1 hypothetical protein GCK72_000930 [Caenorhabditis remanei]
MFRDGLSSGLLELDELLDTIVHLANGLILGEPKTLLVGDVVDSFLRLGVLSMNSTDLKNLKIILEQQKIITHLELHVAADLLKIVLCGDLRQLDVH